MHDEYKDLDNEKPVQTTETNRVDVDELTSVYHIYENIGQSLNILENLNEFYTFLKDKALLNIICKDDIPDNIILLIINTENEDIIIILLKIIKRMLRSDKSKQIIDKCFNDDVNLMLQRFIAENNNPRIVFQAILVCSYVCTDNMSLNRFSNYQLSQHMVDVLSILIPEKAQKIFNAVLTIIVNSPQYAENLTYLTFCVDIWNPSIKLMLLSGLIDMGVFDIEVIFPHLMASENFIGGILNLCYPYYEGFTLPMPLAPIFVDNQSRWALEIMNSLIRCEQNFNELINFIDVEGLLINIKKSYLPIIQTISMKILQFIMQHRNICSTVLDAELDYVQLIRDGRIDVKAETMIFLSVFFDHYKDPTVLNITSPELLQLIIDNVTDPEHECTQNAVFCLNSLVNLFEFNKFTGARDILTSQEFFEVIDDIINDEDSSDALVEYCEMLLTNIQQLFSLFPE